MTNRQAFQDWNPKPCQLRRQERLVLVIRLCLFIKQKLLYCCSAWNPVLYQSLVWSLAAPELPSISYSTLVATIIHVSQSENRALEVVTHI